MAPVIRRLYDQMLDPEVGDLDGRLLLVDGRVQQLRAGPLGQVHADRRPRARLPAAPRGAGARDPAPARQDPGPRARPAGASATTRSGTEEVLPEHRSRPAPRSTCCPEETPPVPDATGLELTAHELRDADARFDPRHRVSPRPGGAADQPRARGQPVLDGAARQGLHVPGQPARRRLLPRGAAARRALRAARHEGRRPDHGQGAGADRRAADRARSSSCSRGPTIQSARSTTCSESCSTVIPTCGGS